MRYWIYWNDLVQGPFELEELTSLKAFSEELPICLEDRTDWIPACRIADLAPAIEQLRMRRYPPPPPPPPPSGPPARTPLQGEFFTEPTGQVPLFFDEGPQKGPFTVDEASGAGASTLLWGDAVVTTPIRFGSVVLAPAPPKADPQGFEAFTTPKIDPIRPAVIRESPVPHFESEELETPPPPPPPLEAHQAIPLEIFTQPGPAESPAAAAAQPVLPDMEVPAPEAKPFNWRLIAWVGGSALGIMMALLLGHRWLDFSTSRSAIAATKKSLARMPKVMATPIKAMDIPVAAAAPVVTASASKIAAASKRVSEHAAHTAKAVIAKSTKAVLKPHHATPRSVASAVAPLIAKTVVPEPTQTSVSASPASMPGLAMPKKTAANVAPTPLATPVDPWIGRHNDAITIVMEKKIAGGKQSIGVRARIMLEEMHDRELLHAAETGQRLYEPDKITWTALRQEGDLYRVYLNFSSLQATGERLQSRSYQFRVRMEKRTVDTDDSSAVQDFLNTLTPLVHKRESKAEDIENILSAVDLLNKQKMRAIIVKNNRRNRSELKNIEAATKAADVKVQRALAYFRTRYPETVLQNVARAYEFTALLKAKVNV